MGGWGETHIFALFGSTFRGEPLRLMAAGSWCFGISSQERSSNCPWWEATLLALSLFPSPAALAQHSHFLDSFPSPFISFVRVFFHSLIYQIFSEHLLCAHPDVIIPHGSL
jgi:hypothetical protein